MAEDQFFSPALSGVCVSSGIGDVGCTISSSSSISSAVVSLKCVSTGDTLYSQRLYGSRMAYVRDVGDIVAEYLKAKGLAAARFSMESSYAGSEKISFTVIRCDSTIEDAEVFVTKNPLLASSSVVMRPDATAWFNYLNDTGEADSTTISFWIFYSDYSGKVKSMSRTMFSAGKTVRSLNIEPSEMLTHVRSRDSSAEAVLRISVSAQCVHMPHPISAVYFVDPDQDLVGFGFRNAFGLNDVVFFRARTSRSAECSASEAFCSHSRMAYDVEKSVEYSVEARAVRFADAELLSQFMNSDCIYELSSGREIYIVSSNMDISDGSESLSEVKFSYRYVDDRPLMDIR